MTWSEPEDLRAQLRSLWDRGLLLESIAAGTDLFPLQLKFRGPSSAREIADRFSDVRAWISRLQATPHVRIVSESEAHRLLGTNMIPRQAWVDDRERALEWIGKEREARLFTRMVDLAREVEPALVSWLRRRPLRALELTDQWELLLSIVTWVTAHPRPGIYLRQIDLPGVHTKFMESHRGVLSELLDLALPEEAINARYSGVAGFSARYGFREKPSRIRFRVLDPAILVLAGASLPDVTIDAESFRSLDIDVHTVFIVENETNFLAFPSVEGAIVVFGGGYGWEAFRGADWLSRCRVYYWGDIDTHGFAILDQLRAVLPRVNSFLMDRATLMAHREVWGTEPVPSEHRLMRLSEDELQLFDDLSNNRLGDRVRLEQERIGFAWCEGVVERLRNTRSTST